MTLKVSVIIPVYNAEKFIKGTIDSVLAQTYQKFEIIVIDDGSTDKSAEIIKSFDDKRIIYTYQKNQGVSAARNKGILESNGKYIAFLDHDDLWLPEKLERQIPILEANANVGLVYSDCYIIDLNRHVLRRYFKDHRPHRGKVLPDLFLDDFIPCLTAIIRKSILNHTGFFNLELSIVEEYDLFLRIAESYEIEYIDLPLAEYRIHETNFSKNFVLGSQELIKLLSKFFVKAPKIKEALGTKVNLRFCEAHYSLARAYSFQRQFLESRKDFLASIKYNPLYIKSYIGYLCSLLKIVIPNRENALKNLISFKID